jgi:type I restriction enzyme S subunit
VSSTDPCPKGWETIPLRYVCKLNPSVAFDGLDEDDDLTFLPMDRVKCGFFIPHTEKFSKHGSSYTAFENGDIVMAKVTPCFENGNIAIADDLAGGKGFGSSELFIIRPTVAECKFLFYYLQSSIFKQDGEASMTGAGGLKRVSPDVLRQHHLPCPSQDIQRHIANYLDRETSRIDGLIAEKKCMLALLEEKRSALISRVVTRGLDLEAPVKDSGQEWLGEIPAHWGVLRLKFATSGIDQGSSPQCYSYPAGPGEWGVLKTGCVNGGEFREQENKALPDDAEAFPDSEVHQGDVLMSRASGSVYLIGSVAHVTRQPAARLLLSDKIYRFRVRSAVLNPRFLVLAMSARYLRHQIKSVISGAEGLANNIAKSDIMELLLVVPPMLEQERIVNFLDRAISNSQVLCGSLGESIALANERRAALITAAVTGQIPLERMNK